MTTQELTHESVDSALSAFFANRDSVLELRKSISNFHKTHRVIWKTGVDTYTCVTQISPEKIAHDSDKAHYLITRITVQHGENGKISRVVKSSGLPVVKVLSTDNGKMEFSVLTTALKRKTSYLLSDKKLAGTVTAKALKLAREHGLGYSELSLEDSSIDSAIDEILSVAIDL